MDLRRLRSFVAVADALHFGRAAQTLDMLPAALGRDIALLEEDLRTRLIERTTRHVSLTDTGVALLEDARFILERAETVASGIRSMARATASTVRLGAIDSAAAGLVPQLLKDVHDEHPDIRIELVEDKTVRLLPQLQSGRIDLAFVRPPEAAFSQIEFLPLLHESAVVALWAGHPLARKRAIAIQDLVDEPLIVPARRSRPHSYDLTIKLFAEAGIRPRIGQSADEKQTIVGLVAARLGSAIVPRWASNMMVSGVVFRRLRVEDGPFGSRLPLAAAWLRGARDPTRDRVMAVVKAHLPTYAERA